jgi:hypothetical protein
VSSVPLRNVNVTLYEATTGSPYRLAHTKSDSCGHFQITSSKDSSESIFYLSAQVDVGVQFVAVLGPSLPSSVTMNELTTVAGSYSMAQFYRTGVISGDPGPPLRANCGSSGGWYTHTLLDCRGGRHHGE